MLNPISVAFKKAKQENRAALLTYIVAGDSSKKQWLEILKSISKNVSRSLTTIYSLQTSLDFDKGGKIATGLFQIYEYCRLQIIKGFSKSVNSGILKAKNALDQILAAWSSMDTKSI